jgi:predicted nucleotidyltransferase
MKVPAPSLAPILRSDTQGRILARLFADPAKGYNLSELVEWAGSSMPTVQREVGRIEAAGIVKTEKVGPARLVRANPDHPLFDALRQVVLSTYGPPAVIAREFRGIEGAEAVVLFGSWAARYLGHPGRVPNDIDVLVIGSPNRDTVDDAAERVERAIGVPVQATVRSRAQWDAASEGFIKEVRSRPLVLVLAPDDDPLLVGELRQLDGLRREAP